jgi:CheY-like chemotaxis protein
MTTVLVVDDSALDLRKVEKLLSKECAASALCAQNGKQALQLLKEQLPDAVLTDLQMPEMDGLQLVEEVRRQFPSVPVILMTAHGSEEIAVQALEHGAASYVPKRNLAKDLPETLQSVIEIAQSRRNQERLLESLIDTESHFVLENDTALIPSLIGHLETNLNRMKICDENGLLRVAVALREALVNAIHHGNLEIGYDQPEHGEKQLHKQIEARRKQEPYQDRRVHVTAKETHREAIYVIRDEGPGFDVASLPDPTDPANMEKMTGRGLLLIRTFMDEVQHNKAGNEITLVKRRD